MQAIAPINAMAVNNQKQQILAWFLVHPAITKHDADRIGIANLKGRIHELRNMGHDIPKDMIAFKTNLNKKGFYAQYFYKGFDPDYIKPEKINNKLLLKTVAEYVTKKAEQLEAVYKSRLTSGKLKQGTFDSMVKRHKELINFVNQLK